jgi:hypothetical protein
MLALAILGTALAALGQIIVTGARAGAEARDLARAQLLCHTKMEELALQTAAIQPGDWADCNAPWAGVGYRYRVELQPAARPGLQMVRVTVQKQSPGEMTDGLQTSLVRWLIDPSLQLNQLQIDQLNAEMEAAAAQSQQQGGGASGAGGSGAGPPSPGGGGGGR